MILCIPSPSAPGSSVDLYTLTGAPSGGTWGGPIVSSSGDIYPEQVGPGVYNVSYSFTNSFGCESSDDLEIIITSTSK